MRIHVRGALVALGAAPVIAVGGAASASANQVVTVDNLCYMVASQVSNVTQSATGGTATAGQVLAANQDAPVALVTSAASQAPASPAKAPAVTDAAGKAVAVTAVEGKALTVTALPSKDVTVTKVAGNSFVVSTDPGKAPAVKGDTPVALVASNDSSASASTNGAAATASANNNNTTNQQIIQTCKVYYLPALAAAQNGSEATHTAVVPPRPGTVAPKTGGDGSSDVPLGLVGGGVLVVGAALLATEAERRRRAAERP
jgi:hypothetical protein